MSLETRLLIEKATTDARRLDHTLIDGRQSIVRRNIIVIEGKNRSEKYVGRLAGDSPDVYRKSRSEGYAEWLGATGAMEDPVLATMVGEFLRPLIEYPFARPVSVPFWDADETLSACLSQVRQSVATGDASRAKFYACQAKNEIEKMLRSIEGMG